jgi:hypothetical protein
MLLAVNILLCTVIFIASIIFLASAALFRSSRICCVASGLAVLRKPVGLIEQKKLRKTSIATTI